MKYKLSMIGMVFLVLTVCNYWPMSARLNKANYSLNLFEKSDVRFNLRVSGYDDNQKTTVYFLRYAEGEEVSYKACVMSGEATEVQKNEFKTYGIPKSASLACVSFLSGVGEVVYIMDKGSTFEVYKGTYYEGDSPKPKFSKINTLKI